MASNNTFSIYVPNPLHEQVVEAVQAGRFKVKDVCLAALEQALSDQSEPQTYGESGADQIADEYDYEVQFVDVSGVGQLIQLATDRGGYPISVAPDAASGKLCVLLGLPKTPA